MQQHQLMQMQPMMAGFNPNNVTTDIIQQYLDENKQLILQILDNQSSGKLSECAENQARLQRNLMYLAAIADSQPQPSPLHAQFLPPAAMQGARYLQHQQAQQMTASSLAAARSSMMYGQQPLSALQQQSMHSQLGMGSGVNSGFHLLNNETGMGGNGALTAGSFSDFGRNGDGLQAATRSLMGGGKQDGGHVSSSEGRGSQSADGSEALYLKGNEEGN